MSKSVATSASVLACLAGLAAAPAHAGFDQVAATFPVDIVPIDAGRIEFWAKLNNYSGVIGWGQQPTFFSAASPPPSTGAPTDAGWMMAFNGNDGTGSGGLTGAAGSIFLTGTGEFWKTYTYESLLPGGGWHHYAMTWNKDGLSGDPSRKIEITLDGVLGSGIVRASASTDGGWRGLPGTTFDVITTSFPSLTGKVSIDEMKIYDGSDRLVFHNTFDSIAAIESSAVGAGGRFAGGYGARFEPGVDGNALTAGIPEPGTWALWLLGLATLAGRQRRRR